MTVKALGRIVSGLAASGTLVLVTGAAAPSARAVSRAVPVDACNAGCTSVPDWQCIIWDGSQYVTYLNCKPGGSDQLSMMSKKDCIIGVGPGQKIPDAIAAELRNAHE